MKTFLKNASPHSGTSGCCQPGFHLVHIAYIHAEDYPDWEFPLHRHHKGVEISVILHGKGLLYYNRQFHEMGQDDIVIRNEGTVHAEVSDRSEPIEQICMLFEGVKAPGMKENRLLPEDAVPVVRVAPVHVIRSMAFHIRHLCVTDTCSEVQQQLSRALVETVWSALPPAAAPVEDRDYCVVRSIQEYIDHHYNEELSLKTLANLFYIDPYYFAHRFKEVTGFSFRQYVISRRMGEAERLLLLENRPIGEVSQLVGYKNLQYFYHSFRKYVGCTPAEFREKYK